MTILEIILLNCWAFYMGYLWSENKHLTIEEDKQHDRLKSLINRMKRHNK